MHTPIVKTMGTEINCNNFDFGLLLLEGIELGLPLLEGIEIGLSLVEVVVSDGGVRNLFQDMLLHV
jgi:hypothetical protein